MEKRRIEINDKRAAAAEEAGEELVDLGENQVHVDVPESDPELGSAAGPAADGPVAAGPRPAEGITEQDSGSGPESAGRGPESAGRGPAATEDVEHFRAKATEYLELAQRKEAELRNYVKRVQQDMEDARRYAVESLLESLFPALDGLAQAARTYKDKPAGSDPLLDGVRGTIRALEGALLRHGIQKINDCPAPYDPELHQALTVEDSADVAEDTVTEIYVEGYRLGDKILKPAMVKVTKAV